MKSYFDYLEILDETGTMKLGDCEELSCSCFRTTSLFTNRWYYKEPSHGRSIYIDKDDKVIELALTWKNFRIGVRSIYR